jgi:hypothetical protein
VYVTCTFSFSRIRIGTCNALSPNIISGVGFYEAVTKVVDYETSFLYNLV